MSKFVVLLNGPAGSGKDTVADLMADIMSDLEPVTRLAFKDALYEKTASHFNLNLEWFKQVATDRTLKERESELIKHKGKRLSPREALIMVSEQIIKPCYGRGYFGAILASKLKDGINIVSDSGFNEETLEVLQAIKPGCMIIVNMERDNLTFQGDSRNYITRETLMDCCEFNPEYENLKAICEEITLAKFRNETGNMFKIVEMCLDIHMLICQTRRSLVARSAMLKHKDKFPPELSAIIKEVEDDNLKFTQARTKTH